MSSIVLSSDYINSTGAAGLFASRVKMVLFPSDFVRKPRQSAAMPAFSFSFDEKIPHFYGVFIKPAAPWNFGKNMLWKRTERQRKPRLLLSLCFIREFIKRTAKYTKDAKVDRAYSFHRKKQKISFSMPSLYSPYSCSKPVLVLLLRTLRSLPRLLFNLYSPDFLCSSVTLCHVLASLYLP